MLGDAVSAKKSPARPSDTLEVVDVAQLLARSANPPPIPAAQLSQGGDTGGSTNSMS